MQKMRKVLKELSWRNQKLATLPLANYRPYFIVRNNPSSSIQELTDHQPSIEFQHPSSTILGKSQAPDHQHGMQLSYPCDTAALQYVILSINLTINQTLTTNTCHLHGIDLIYPHTLYTYNTREIKPMTTGSTDERVSHSDTAAFL